MKSSQDILAELVSEFVAHQRHGRRDDREIARQKLARFTADYPFRDRPAEVGAVIRTSRDAEEFMRRLERDLGWLGAINLRSNRPIEEAGRKLELFRDLVARMVDPQLSVWTKIDGQWNIAGFGGENRQILKKIVNTYYPELTLPIFNTEHMEGFARYLRLDKDSVSNEIYGRRYASLRGPGEIWHVLSEALIRERNENSHLKNEDNHYFMLFLYTMMPRRRG